MTDRTREIAEKIARILADALINGGQERGRDVVTDIETALTAYGREQRAQGFREGAEAMREAAHAAVIGARFNVPSGWPVEARLHDNGVDAAARAVSTLPLPTPPDGESGEST